jgi:hypothetical protein
MRIALGLKSHSGWAALVAVGGSGSDLHVVDRRRVTLVDADAQWAKQPYHAAQALAPDRARELVQCGIDGAGAAATRELRTVLTLLGESGHVVVACAVLVPPPMPDWSTEDILAVHVRMHKAEGVLFPTALCTAAETNGLRLVVIPEKALDQYAARSLGVPPSRVNARVGALGKSLGPPWGQDQKKAALAAVVALKSAAVGRG